MFIKCVCLNCITQFTEICYPYIFYYLFFKHHYRTVVVVYPTIENPKKCIFITNKLLWPTMV